jgi:hypothetical protein
MQNKISRLISKDIKEHGATQSPFLSYMRLLHSLPIDIEGYQKATGKDVLSIFKKLYSNIVKKQIKEYLKVKGIKNRTRTIAFRSDSFALAIHIYNASFKEVMTIENDLKEAFDGINLECYEYMPVAEFNTPQIKAMIK